MTSIKDESEPLFVGKEYSNAAAATRFTVDMNVVTYVFCGIAIMICLCLLILMIWYCCKKKAISAKLEARRTNHYYRSYERYPYAGRECVVVSHVGKDGRPQLYGVSHRSVLGPQFVGSAFAVSEKLSTPQIILGVPSKRTVTPPEVAQVIPIGNRGDPQLPDATQVGPQIPEFTNVDPPTSPNQRLIFPGAIGPQDSSRVHPQPVILGVPCAAQVATQDPKVTCQQVHKQPLTLGRFATPGILSIPKGRVKLLVCDYDQLTPNKRDV